MSMTVDQETPLQRLSGNEPGAVEACVDAYGPLVQALARRLLPTESETEDVVQEVFVDLWRSAHRFDSTRASDGGFVAMIARRRIIDRKRREGRRPQTVALSAHEDAPSDEHDRTIGRVQATPAMEALATLAEDRKRWILMSVVEGYSHSEIAARTGSPLGTVKSGIRRGLADMRAWLEDDETREVAP